MRGRDTSELLFAGAYRAQEQWMQETGAEVLRRLGRAPPLKVPSPVEESLIDELVMKVASPRTKDLLQDYAEQYRVRPLSSPTVFLLTP